MLMQYTESVLHAASTPNIDDGGNVGSTLLNIHAQNHPPRLQGVVHKGPTHTQDSAGACPCHTGKGRSTFSSSHSATSSTRERRRAKRAYKALKP